MMGFIIGIILGIISGVVCTTLNMAGKKSREPFKQKGEVNNER